MQIKKKAKDWVKKKIQYFHIKVKNLQIKDEKHNIIRKLAVVLIDSKEFLLILGHASRIIIR